MFAILLDATEALNLYGFVPTTIPLTVDDAKVPEYVVRYVSDLPDDPELPALLDEPEEPLEPELPLEPEDPLEPELPEEPAEPELPAEPEEPC